jgi:hypothetical protein
MADENQPRIAVGIVEGSPAFEGRFNYPLKAAGVVATAQTPVVGKRQQIAGCGEILGIGQHQLEPLHKPGQQPVVADVGAPDARQNVQIGHQCQRFHPIARMVIAQVNGESEALNTGAEAPDRLPNSTG